MVVMVNLKMFWDLLLRFGPYCPSAASFSSGSVSSATITFTGRILLETAGGLSVGLEGFCKFPE
jgi:hypothetical protein